MSARGVRIVVGEGPSERKGLLRFVVDGEGYDVVAEASTTAELARLMATHRPDVVVLDDGIGATAVGMINEMSPNTKVVLVWPGAVMPVGGAARVEPARVLQDLGPTIERLTGQPSATSSGRGPALIESATSDPDMLNAMLLGGVAATDEAIIEDREPAPVVILPLTPTIDHDDLILNVPEAEPDDEHTGAGATAGIVAGAAGAAAIAGSGSAAAAEGGGAAVTSLAARGSAVGAQSALNRRLGNLALGGAAVASALVLALALGGARVPIGGIRGTAASPPITSTPTPGVDNPPGTDGETDGGENGNGGNGGEAGDGTTGDLSRTGSPGITLVGGTTPEPPGPPDVGVDPGDIGPGDGSPGGDGGGGSGLNDGGGSDDHSGGDAGDEDLDGGDGDHDKGGGNDGDGDDHDNGGGNDGDGDDHDNGGGNDDEDNPGHGDGEPGDGNGGGGDNGGNGGGGDNGGNGGGGGNGGDTAETASDGAPETASDGAPESDDTPASDGTAAESNGEAEGH